MPEPDRDTHVIYELAGAVSVLSEAVRTLSRSLYGERSDGPEDGYGQLGEHIATLCSEVERRTAKLVDEMEIGRG